MEILFPVLIVTVFAFLVVAFINRPKKRGHIPGDTANSSMWGWMLGDSGSTDSSPHHHHHHSHDGASSHHSHHYDSGSGHHGGFGGGHHGGFDGGGGHSGGHH